MTKTNALILSLFFSLFSFLQVKGQTTSPASTTTTKKVVKAKIKPKKTVSKVTTANAKPVTNTKPVTTSPAKLSLNTKTTHGGTILVKPTPIGNQPASTAPAGAAPVGRGGATPPGDNVSNPGANNQPTTTTPARGGAVTPGTTTTTTTSTVTDFTQNDAASAIRSALSGGITNAVSQTSVVNGFFGNNDIKIPFPQDAALVETTMRSVGMGSMVDNVILSLNRAAENAAGQATPIFLGAIKQLTITDAVNIVSGSQQDAATQFLQRTTTEQLVAAFKPTIKTALDNVNATKYWAAIMTQYNRMPFITPVSTDLPDYVTRKAISGLFVMVAREEAKIRQNPFGQADQVVRKVFGSVKTR